MNKIVTVSIIVPVYKVEKYLQSCVDSILDQTFTDYELILVDDGSPDNCGLICDDYKKIDTRVTVIHKSNGGLSDARNAGIDIAKGYYITFIDSDDKIAPNFLETMISHAQNDHSDIVQVGFTSVEDKLNEIEKDKKFSIYTDNDKILRDYLRFKGIQGYACGKLYKTALFKTIRYPVGIIQEDAWVTYKLLYECSGLTVIECPLYFYRINTESIMNGRFNPERFNIMRVPDDIRQYLGTKSFDFEDDLDYYTMRIGLKTYNDCISKKCDQKYKDKMNSTRKTVCAAKRNTYKWERKYVVLVSILKCVPFFYKQLIKSMRR